MLLQLERSCNAMILFGCETVNECIFWNIIKDLSLKYDTPPFRFNRRTSKPHWLLIQTNLSSVHDWTPGAGRHSTITTIFTLRHTIIDHEMVNYLLNLVLYCWSSCKMDVLYQWEHMVFLSVLSKHRHDDVIKRKYLPRYWPFCAGNSPIPVKGQCRGAFMFSFICVRINDRVNNREAGDLRCTVIIMTSM